jgi:hypothetical protein
MHPCPRGGCNIAGSRDNLWIIGHTTSDLPVGESRVLAVRVDASRTLGR